MVAVLAGAGLPLFASWAGVYSTAVVFVLFETHRFPAASKATPVG